MSRPFPLAGMALTLTLGLLSACSKTDAPTTPEAALRPVRSLVIGAVDDSHWRDFPGTVDAAQKAELGFRIAGKLQRLHVNEGDFVRQGDVLAQLDDTDLAIALKSAQADYQRAHDDFLRGQALIDKGVIAQSDFSRLQAQDVAAQANLEAAQRNLSFAALKAPFSGRIARRYVENYEELSALAPVYALHDLSSLLVKVDLPENLMLTTQPNDRPEAYAVFAGIPGQAFPLRLKAVSSRADPATQLFGVTLAMAAHPDYNILPGMSVTVRGRPPVDGASAGAILVPPHAVQEDGDGRHVWLLLRQADGTGLVQRQPVTTGELHNNGLAILSGLQIGDEVVIAGMSKMHPGLKVRLSQERGQ